jgi:hypothetical protein
MNQFFKMTAVAILVFPGFASASMPRCEALAGSPPERLIQFLKDGQSGNADPNCTEYALRRLADEKVHEAIPVLAAYLGFRRPETDREKMGMGGALGTIGNDFPASFALSQMGRAALPALVHVIETDSGDVLVHQNGIYTIMRIFHYDVSGIEFLTHSAATAKSTDSQSRLAAAAKEAVSWCSASAKSTCESAASRMSK